MSTTDLALMKHQAPSAAKTAYPEFDIPDLESSCSSDDENSVERAKYSTKEDQDVAVFMLLAENLSLRSLLHLLQGHVRAQQGYHYTDAVNAVWADSSNKNTLSKRKKQFRFAEIAGGTMIRQVIHEIESYKDMKELWWSDEEMMQVRMQAIETVKHFRKHRKAFITAVETVSSAKDPLQIDTAIKQLARDSFARGLETHICTFLSQKRVEIVAAVLEEQKQCRMCGDSYDLTAASLRSLSLVRSLNSRTFAEKLGEADHIDALKATMSSWYAEMA